MKLLSITVSSFFLLLLSCTPSNQGGETTVSISKHLFKSEDHTITVSNIHHGILENVTKTENEFEIIRIKIDEPSIITLEEKRAVSHIFIEPGQHLQLSRHSIEDGKSILVVDDKEAKINNYLKEFAILLHSTEQSSSIGVLGKMEPDSFLISLNNKFTSIVKLTSSILQDNSINSKISTSIKNRISHLSGLDKLTYNLVYKHHHGEMPMLPSDFYKSIEDLQFNEAILTFEEGRQLVDRYAEFGVDYEASNSLTEYFNALYDKAKTKYDDPLVGNYVKLVKLENQINFGGGLDGMDNKIEDFKTGLTNEYFRDRLSLTEASWSKLRKGAIAPDFKGTTRDGKVVNLSDLKGKAVYVDVWATWCGPCIREIPALKELEKSMHDQGIEFVSISVDEAKNKDKWLAFIEEKELGGKQLLADGAFNSEVSTNYNIKGIPRFILVDAEGILVSANAPRPSDESTEALLKNTL